MKILDERGRVFGKINLFDLIALAVLLVGGLLLVLKPWSKPEGEPAPSVEYHHAEIKLQGSDLREQVAMSIKEGDPLYEGNKKLGVIKKVEIEKHKEDTLMPDGSYQAIERALRYDVLVTIETERYYEDKGRYVNGASMLNGSSHTFSTGTTQFEAVVWNTIPGDKVQ